MDTPAWMQVVERRREQAAEDARSCLAQAGIQPRRHSGAGRNPVIYAIHARKAGMTKELFPRAGRHRNPFHTPTPPSWIPAFVCCAAGQDFGFCGHDRGGGLLGPACPCGRGRVKERVFLRQGAQSGWTGPRRPRLLFRVFAALPGPLGCGAAPVWCLWLSQESRR